MKKRYEYRAYTEYGQRVIVVGFGFTEEQGKKDAIKRAKKLNWTLID